MEKSQFWNLIESAENRSNGSCDEQVKILQRQLEKLSTEEIIAFDQILDEFTDLSYRTDLWAAAYIINGGCSDDGFYYFRAWLISHGESVFTDALKDPQTLANVEVDAEEGAECEALLYAAMTAYQEKTGSEMPARKRLYPKLIGPEWRECDLDTMYPALWAKSEAD